MLSLNNPKFQEIISKDTKKLLTNLIEKLEEETEAFPFLEPVDYKGKINIF
jgi:hypothetical protein